MERQWRNWWEGAGTGFVHAEVCMTRLSTETRHKERCHCEFVTDSVNLQSEGEKKREGEIFPGLWDTVILIKSRRAEKESWEIKSVQHRRTHAAKHGKNNCEKEDNRMKPTPQSQYTDTDFFLSWDLAEASAVCRCLAQADYHLQLSAVSHCQNFRKHYKTKKIHLCATSQKWKDG